MEIRKSFILHIDSLSILDELNDEQSGKLIKAIRSYHLNDNLDLDQLTKIALAPFINQFKRDDEKWNKSAERSRSNGLKGGRPKSVTTQNNPEQPAGLSRLQKEPKEPVSVSVNDSVNVNGNVSVSEKKNTCQPGGMTLVKNDDVNVIFNYWLKAMGKNANTSKLTTKRRKVINDRLKDKYSVTMILSAIDGCLCDPFSMGVNERKKPYNDIELICRTGEKLESFYNTQKPYNPKEFF
jgi:hypothetical protein